VRNIVISGINKTIYSSILPTAFSYNVGALTVLKLLKECEVVGISEYLQEKSDEAEVQGIIADLIDLDDAEELLADVIKASQSSEVLNSHFQECLRQYTFDVLMRPELIQHEFISSVKRLLPEGVFRDLIALRFLEEALNIEYKKVLEISAVISNQKTWNCEFAGEKLEVFNKVVNRLAEHNSEMIAKLFLQHLQSPDINWFIVLIVLRHIDQKSKGFDDIKRELTLSRILADILTSSSSSFPQDSVQKI
jgi:hypothetical protein